MNRRFWVSATMVSLFVQSCKSPSNFENSSVKLDTASHESGANGSKYRLVTIPDADLFYQDADNLYFSRLKKDPAQPEKLKMEISRYHLDRPTKDGFEVRAFEVAGLSYNSLVPMKLAPSDQGTWFGMGVYLDENFKIIKDFNVAVHSCQSVEGLAGESARSFLVQTSGALLRKKIRVNGALQDGYALLSRSGVTLFDSNFDCVAHRFPLAQRDGPNGGIRSNLRVSRQFPIRRDAGAAEVEREMLRPVFMEDLYRFYTFHPATTDFRVTYYANPRDKMVTWTSAEQVDPVSTRLADNRVKSFEDSKRLFYYDRTAASNPGWLFGVMRNDSVTPESTAPEKIELKSLAFSGSYELSSTIVDSVSDNEIFVAYLKSFAIIDSSGGHTIKQLELDKAVRNMRFNGATNNFLACTLAAAADASSQCFVFSKSGEGLEEVSPYFDYYSVGNSPARAQLPAQFASDAIGGAFEPFLDGFITNFPIYRFVDDVTVSRKVRLGYVSRTEAGGYELNGNYIVLPYPYRFENGRKSVDVVAVNNKHSAVLVRICGVGEVSGWCPDKQFPRVDVFGESLYLAVPEHG